MLLLYSGFFETFPYTISLITMEKIDSLTVYSMSLVQFSTYMTTDEHTSFILDALNVGVRVLRISFHF